MKNVLLLTLSLFVSKVTHAGFWCPEKPNEIRFPKPNAGCFEVGEGFDVETAAVVNGALVVDSVKKAAKDAAELVKKQEKEAKAQKIADCASVLSAVDAASKLEDLKAVVKCLVEMR